MKDFTISPVSDVIGAEVVGLDVSEPLDGETVATLRQAFQDHHLICFRDQVLTDEQLTAFSTQFGPLEIYPEEDMTKGTIEVYHVANVSLEGEHLRTMTRAWSISAITGAGTRTVRTGISPPSPRSCMG